MDNIVFKIDHIQFAFTKAIAIPLIKLFEALGFESKRVEEDPAGEWGFAFFEGTLQITWLKSIFHFFGTHHIALSCQESIADAIHYLKPKLDNAGFHLTEIDTISDLKAILIFKLKRGFSDFEFGIEIISTEIK